MEILKYKDVLSEDQIMKVKEDALKIAEGIDSDEYYDYSVLFGLYVNGFCLVYLVPSYEYFTLIKIEGNNHTNIIANDDNVDYDYFDECKNDIKASFIIDKNGRFLKLECKNKEFSVLDIGKYDKDVDIILYQFEFTRIFRVDYSHIFDTDEMKKWILNSELEPTEDIIYNIKYSVGDTFIYSGEDEDGFDEDDSYLYESGICYPNYRMDLVYLYKGEIVNFTNVNIHSRYLLLKYCVERPEWEDDSYLGLGGFNYCFPKMLIDDVYKPHYGVFDLSSKRVIIHCGERKENGAYINGFIRLVFENSKIYTFDKFDNEIGKGIPYSYNMTKSDVVIVSESVYKNQKLLPTNIINDPYYIRKGYRNGKNAGILFILREGPNAGRNITWLKWSDPNTLFKYIECNYLHINCMNEFSEFGFDGKEDRFWIINDQHYDFEDIKDASDRLYISQEVSRYFEFSESKHEGATLESIIENDTKYISGLIKSGCVNIDMQVFDEMRKRRSDNKTFINKMSIVEKHMKKRQEIINKKIEEWEYEMESAQRREWEEEEQRWYQNEGYRAAFEDEPEAEWNID